MSGCLSAVIRAVLITEYLLLTAVRGDGADPEVEVDIKYVFIGAGAGVFIVAGCIILLVCREKLCDGNTVAQVHSERSRGTGTSRADSLAMKEAAE
ncbi:hypothetical protein PBY51_001363 [Eleginops maclovinus]|uniref:Uncharacterized protein n=1 Tax=Eleginops maclovinus TaxID=56733 RepID=A0AAN7WXQ5_ELEMC|nr:hypothetical protein PBY51_001363 [Eleginops maclovinus]